MTGVLSFSHLPSHDRELIAYLRSPRAIRDRCSQLFDLACADQLRYFRVDLSQLAPTADYVLQVMRSHYPDLDIPFHSRWRHFEVGGSHRLVQLVQALQALSPRDRAQAEFDLAIISVLLDAGAGATWHYVEPNTGEIFQRSEGLAVASFHLFRDGVFSSDPTHHPLRVDAIALQALTLEQLAHGFQVSDRNPLVGLEGRLTLLHRLGQVLCQHPTYFGTAPARPGHLVNFLWEQVEVNQLPASTVLAAVLSGLGDIWAGRLTHAGVNLGDVWRHPAIAADPPLVPFHKLSQWLTYSLLEPLQTLGITITDLDQLTGLPEYRNGGLCVDLGLLVVKDPTILQAPQAVDSEAIVEWRALTVICLDRIADYLRQTLNLTADAFPLVKVLQGGTWTAGREIAATLRPGGTPPIQIRSDGTVF